MQYKKMNNEIYLRIDKDEPLIESIKNVSKQLLSKERRFLLT